MPQPIEPPHGRCPACSGPLTWGRLVYQPPLIRDGDGHWQGLEPACADGLREHGHPCSPPRPAGRWDLLAVHGRGQREAAEAVGSIA